MLCFLQSLCRLALLSIALLFSMSLYAQPTIDLGMGWNMGNQMDAFRRDVAREGAWGNPRATRATFRGVREAGFTSVRIPITWMGHIGAAPDYTIQEQWLERVAELVGYAEQEGLKVIINLHHDGADDDHWINIKRAVCDDAARAQIAAQIAAVWRQIAERFRDKGEFLMFESFNEIHDGDWGHGANRTDGGRQYAILNEWNQLFVDVVRLVGGENSTRYLGVPSYSANDECAIEGFVMPNDSVEDRLLLSIHYYYPHDYTLENKYDEWGYMSSTNSGSHSDELQMDAFFSRIKEHFLDRGIMVYIGEFGCSRRRDASKEAMRQYYLESFCRRAGYHSLPIFLWDNGVRRGGRESHGYLDHATGKFIGNGELMVAAMAAAYAEGCQSSGEE